MNIKEDATKGATQEASSEMKDMELAEMQRIGNALAPALGELIRQATIGNKLPEDFDEHLLIGKARIPNRKVTPIGDVDGNGFVDFVVANPNAGNKTGKVRLYLMTEGRAFLYTRKLVPGKSGMKGTALKNGDRYGTVVTPLQRKWDQSAGTFIAIAAPGNGVTGAVYIIKISRKGNVAKSVKMEFHRTKASETKAGAFPEYDVGETPKQNGSHRTGDGKGWKKRGAQKEGHAQSNATLPERRVEGGPSNFSNDLSDVDMILFEAADGEILAALKVNSVSDGAVLRRIEREYLEPLSESTPTPTPTKTPTPFLKRRARPLTSSMDRRNMMGSWSLRPAVHVESEE